MVDYVGLRIKFLVGRNMWITDDDCGNNRETAVWVFSSYRSSNPSITNIKFWNYYHCAVNEVDNCSTKYCECQSRHSLHTQVTNEQSLSVRLQVGLILLGYGYESLPGGWDMNCCQLTVELQSKSSHRFTYQIHVDYFHMV